MSRWSTKLESGRVEIVLFGEIDTGKSALDQRPGRTTKWPRSTSAAAGRATSGTPPWDGSGYLHCRDLERSQVVLIDTPGINEVDGEPPRRNGSRCRGSRRSDLVCYRFRPEPTRILPLLAELAGSHKPILLVFNKTDNYTPEPRTFSARRSRPAARHGGARGHYRDVGRSAAAGIRHRVGRRREQSEFRRPLPDVAR